jgi:hypothetical protein
MPAKPLKFRYKPVPPPTLEQRISDLRAEIDAIIDEHAAALHEEASNVPLPVIRNQLTRGQCQCTVGLRLRKGDA